MLTGLIGSGNMARALALGWGRPVVCSSASPPRAEALAELTGGEAAVDNAAVAAGSEIVVLCHKPAQLDQVAAEIASSSPVILSLLAGVTLGQLRAAYRSSRCYRMMPNLAVELRQGTIGLVDDDGGDSELFAQLTGLLEQLGDVFVVPERQMAVLTAVSGVGPAYFALVAEANVGAAVAEGMPEQLAKDLVGSTVKGAAALLEARQMDSERLCREVASPSGVTEKGLAVLREPLHGLFGEAMNAALGRKP